MDETDATRRRVLRAGGLASTMGLAGCLRLTDEEATGTDERDPAEATPTETARTERPTDEPESTDRSISTCRTDSLPSGRSESVEGIFVDSRNRMHLPGRTAPGSQPCIGWARETEYSYYGRIRGGPVLSQDFLVLHDGTGIVGLSRADGSDAWRLNEAFVDDYRWDRSFAVRNGTLVAMGRNDRTRTWHVVGVDVATGDRSLNVELPVDPEAEERPTAFELGARYAYVATSRRGDDEATGLVAVDVGSGSVAWNRRLASVNLQLEDMAADEDLLVITTDEAPEDEDNVLAVDAETGERRGSQQLPIGEAVPVLGDDHVYLPVQRRDGQDGVVALSRNDGSHVWEFEVLNAPRTGIPIDDRNAYVVTSEELYAVAKSDGSPRWKYSPEKGPKLQGDASGLPVVLDDALLLGSSFAGDQGVIRAVEKGSGDLRWDFTVAEERALSPLVADGVLYAVGLTRTGDDPTQTFYALG